MRDETPIIAYLSMRKDSRGELVRDIETEHGARLGGYWIKSSWKRRDFWAGDRMCAIRAMIAGREYWGRSFGPGMSVVLHPIKLRGPRYVTYYDPNCDHMPRTQWCVWDRELHGVVEAGYTRQDAIAACNARNAERSAT
jgi:hypothetical protein